MPYLVAKKFKEIGSLALKIEIGKELSGLSTELTMETLDRDIEIITVSDILAYKEYGPYTIVDTKEEFVKKIANMK